MSAAVAADAVAAAAVGGGHAFANEEVEEEDAFKLEEEEEDTFTLVEEEEDPAVPFVRMDKDCFREGMAALESGAALSAAPVASGAAPVASGAELEDRRDPVEVLDPEASVDVAPAVDDGAVVPEEESRARKAF